MHLSSIIPENFKALALIIPEILEFIELHSYKFGLVYLNLVGACAYVQSVQKKMQTVHNV